MTGRTDTGTAITLASISKTFPDGTQALRPVDLSVAAGEQLVILGPSGCGKTTLLRIIAGLETTDRGGQVLFDNVDVTGLPIEKRHVGMVFQSYALFPNMNVIENVGYGLRVRGLPRDERKAEAHAALELVRLGSLASRRIDQLSGGQKQRVALARALAVKPRALLLDEPLTALDAALREELRAEIDALLRSLHITTVYVTHDQAEAMVLGDRIVVMDKGGVAQIDSPRDLYFRPTSPFVANFIGTMNALEGEIRDGHFICAAGSFAIDARDASRAGVRFRPERVRVSAAVDSPGTFAVDRVHFLGPIQRLYLRHLESGLSVVADVDNQHNLSPGASVDIQVDPRDFIIF